MVDEALLRKKSRWKQICDIPDFPFSNLEDMRNGLVGRRFSLLIDKSLVNQLAVIFCGRIGRLIFLIFFMLYLALPVGLIVMSIYFRSFGVLLGLPAYALMFFLSIPALRIHQSVSLVGYASIICAAVSVFTGHDSAAMIFGTAAITFLLVRLYYYLNSRLMMRAALSSEAVFIYLFERAAVAIKDNVDGCVHCRRETGSVDDFT